MQTSGMSFLLGSYSNAHANALEKMRRGNIAARIWAHDFNVWKPSPHEISNRLAWLHAPVETLSMIKGIRSSLNHFLQAGHTDVVLLGMGGSSLAPEVFSKMIDRAPGHPALHILDTTDPDVIRAVTAKLTSDKTLFLVASKSGKTLEITSLFNYFFNLTGKQSNFAVNEHFIFITDEGSPMLELAWRLNISYVFSNNPNIGGRFSALSIAGLIPAVLVGIDVEKLLHRAARTANAERTDFFSGKKDSPGCRLGAALGVLAQYGRDKLTVILPEMWRPFGDWLEQLIAESTGKEGKGLVPVLNEPPLPADVYGKDRLFVFFENDDGTENSRIAELAAAGHPVIRIRIDDACDLAGQMFLWEMATAVAAHILRINPFDQPDVETTKINTQRRIAEYKKSGAGQEEIPAIVSNTCDVYGNASGKTPAEALENFLKQPPENAYIGLQVYLSPSQALNSALDQLRLAITLRTKRPVTIGHGPRYLHSTGQLHKGDAGNGLFLQLTGAPETDLGIPDEPDNPSASLTFGSLKAFQAEADREALAGLGRKILRFHFKNSAVSELTALALSLK